MLRSFILLCNAQIFSAMYDACTIQKQCAKFLKSTLIYCFLLDITIGSFLKTFKLKNTYGFGLSIDPSVCLFVRRGSFRILEHIEYLLTNILLWNWCMSVRLIIETFLNKIMCIRFVVLLQGLTKEFGFITVYADGILLTL